MGVLLGTLTPVQYLVLAFMETSFAVIVEHILFNILHINDGGRSLVVHCFGCYFGLAAAKVCRRKQTVTMDSQESNFQHSELFSMIGTLFLWIFFPSFNAAAQEPEDARHRAIMNTYLAMASCTLSTFMISSLSDNLGRFNMLHIQSSTLAGGIAVGTVANVILYPHHAVVVGALAGILSVFGHPRILEKKLGLYDTCGVHNLHGMPGLFAGILSIFFVLWYSPAEYGDSIHRIYPYWEGGANNGDRTQLTQAIYQLVGIVVVLFVAIVAGLITGCVLRLQVLNQVSRLDAYEDTNYYLNAKFTLFGENATRHDVLNALDMENGATPLNLQPVY
ncbi:Rh-like protein 2 [Aphelenchoides avenae]|nr:Rh-like protein 2 [Aphelenchus avenae]